MKPSVPHNGVVRDTDKPDKSVLVIILAESRESELTFDLFQKHVLDVCHADLALCVADNCREDTFNAFYRHARYIWRYSEPDDWGDAFDDLQRKSGLDADWRILLEVKKQWLGGVKGEGEQPGSAAILLFFRLFLKERLMDRDVLEKYDRFIVTRSDFMHRIPHVPLALMAPEYIWIPDGEDYCGYTDRHVIAHRDDILDVLSIGDRIISEPGKLFDDMRHAGDWNLERFIKAEFRHLGLTPKVKRFPYTMYTVRSADGHTRWRGGRYNKKLGYCIKYPSEYARYRLASAFINKTGDWTPFTFVLVRMLSYLLISRYRFYRRTEAVFKWMRTVVPQGNNPSKHV